MELRKQIVAEERLLSHYGMKITRAQKAIVERDFAALVEQYGMANAKRIMRARRRDERARLERGK